MSVKRYSVGYKDSASGRYAAMLDKQDGGYVSYEDYAALEARCAALAAENAGLKDEISNITFMRDDDFFGSTQRAQEVMGRLVNFKTPATDAFLAEVRAQGVEMLAEKLRESIAVDSSGSTRARALTRIVDRASDQLRKGVQS
ncbi:hypothetical protein ACQFIN_003872 [Enterobacter hormaechei]